MAVYGVPDIVTDGLVLCLDAANKKSNNGSENILYDLSNNNNNGTIVRSSTTPLGIANCVGWWDASDSNTLFAADTGSTLATSTIGRWANKGTLGSAGDLLQSNSSKRPVISTNDFGGSQSVLFDGIDDSLVRSFTLDASCHIFVVIKWPNAFSSIVRATDGATGNTLSFFRGTSTGLGMIGSAPTSLSATTDTSYPLILEASKNSTNSRFVINGDIQSTGNLDTTSPNGITLGSFGGGNASYDNISFAEVIVYSDPLSVEDAAKVSSYLAAKWAIANYANRNYLNFNGTNEYLGLSQSILATKDRFTWQGFVRFNNMQPLKTTPYYQIYAENNQVWIAQYDNAIGIDLRQSDNVWFDGAGGSARGAQIGKNVICRNIWYNLAWTFDRYGNGGTSGQVKGYLDGQLVVTANTLKTGPIFNNSSNGFIGFWVGNTYFDGDIASFSLHNKKLEDKEILDNYNSLKGRYQEDLSIYENVTYGTDNSADIFISNNVGKNVDMFRSGTAGWNRQFYSTQSFTAPCTIEYRKKAGITDNGASYAMIGWNVDPLSDSSYLSMDYAGYPYRQDQFQIYNNGLFINPSKTWNAAEKLYIVYNTDGILNHYNGSNLLYSVNYGTGKTVYVDTSIYSSSHIFGGFYSVRVTKKIWNGTNYV